MDAEEFIPGGGTALVFEWLTRIADTEPPVDLIWGALDDRLRLALTQGWLMGVGLAPSVVEDPDELAARLSAHPSTHPRFERMLGDVIGRFQQVYGWLDGKPALVGISEPVGVDMELVLFTSEQYVGTFEKDAAIPGHSFITRFADGRWVIAATARRLPVPGWPPTEQVIPGLSIDGPAAS